MAVLEFLWLSISTGFQLIFYLLLYIWPVWVIVGIVGVGLIMFQFDTARKLLFWIIGLVAILLAIGFLMNKF